MNSKRGGSRKKWTNEVIDEFLRGGTFVRLTDTTNVSQPSTTPLQWKCNTCSHIWLARVDNIVWKRSGCPRCAGNVAYTIETFQSKLAVQDRTDLRAVALHPSSATEKYRMADFECLNCNHTWSANVFNVLKFRYGCPLCNDNVSSRVVDASGNKFHSKLEYYFWKQYQSIPGLPTVIRQQRYLSVRRLTCDYFIPELQWWIEVSGTVLLNQGKYSSTIEEKRQITLDKGHRFTVLSSFMEIDAFITKIKDRA